MEMNYVAPELEVLEVVVEAGFAASGAFPSPGGKDEGDIEW